MGAGNRGRTLPDNNEPNGLPTPPRTVICRRCFDEFSSTEMKWDAAACVRGCKNFPQCDGAGYGWDILPFVQSEERRKAT